MTGIGVTGTSGKTVVARVVARLLGRYLKMGYVGNNGIEYGATMMQMTGTTPTQSAFIVISTTWLRRM